MEISGYNNNYSASFANMYSAGNVAGVSENNVSEIEACQDSDSISGADECSQDYNEPVDRFEAQADDSDWGASSEDIFEPSWDLAQSASDSPDGWLMAA